MRRPNRTREKTILCTEKTTRCRIPRSERKSESFLNRTKWLGNEIYETGIKSNTKKMKAILDLKTIEVISRRNTISGKKIYRDYRKNQSIQHGRTRSRVYTNKQRNRQNGGRQKNHGRRNQEGRIHFYARPENTNRKLEYRRRTEPGQRRDETSRTKYGPRTLPTSIRKSGD